MQGWVGSQHVVVYREVLIAELLDQPHVRPDSVRVGGQFGLGIDDAYLHRSGSVHSARLAPRSRQPGDSAMASGDAGSAATRDR
jgi:hypothetical protein